MRNVFRDHPNVTRLLTMAAFVAFWEYAGRNANPLFMTYPSAIAHAFVEIASNGVGDTSWDISSTATSAPLLSPAWCRSSSVLSSRLSRAPLIGGIIGQWRFFEYALDPFINALNAIPRIALVPLIMLWAGIGVGGKVAIIVSLAILPVIINTYAGVRSVGGSMREIGRAFGASESEIFFKITLPAAVPHMMAGIRIAMGAAIIGLIVSEFFTALTGLGSLMMRYASVFATDKLFVPIIVIALMGVLFTLLVQSIESRISKWRVLERERAPG
jgi:NitT/TauT family transport system permease protein